MGSWCPARPGWFRAGRPRPLAGLLGPVDYTADTRYRPVPALYRRLQPLAWLLTRLGLSPGDVVTLEVPGRSTGEIRRSALVQVVHGGRRYLVSLAGESDWVRNVRAADGRAVLGRRRRRAVTLVELPASDRPRIVQAYLRRPGRRGRSPQRTGEARHYFGVGPGAALDELRDVAARHPVFLVEMGWAAHGQHAARFRAQALAGRRPTLQAGCGHRVD